MTCNSCGIHERFKNINSLIKKANVDAFLLSFEPNITYAAGFHAPDSYLLISSSEMILITDFRYTADFKTKAQKPLLIKELKGSIFKSITEVIKERKLKKIGFESRHLTFAECEILHNQAKKSFSFIPLKETIEPLREIKNPYEIDAIKKGLQITRAAYAFIENKLKPGKSELAIAAELERFIRLKGATSSAFDIIVASGPNSSYPHARISDRLLQKGDVVLIDMGVEYKGYKCDLTRPFFLGKIPSIVQKVTKIVQLAQQKAIENIRPGRTIHDIDISARHFIAKKGFGKNFGHSLGHGVGLEVHESPSINSKNHNYLKPGMVFTIEPGIYITGKFGIRIEDMVLVTNNSAEIL